MRPAGGRAWVRCLPRPGPGDRKTAGETGGQPRFTSYPSGLARPSTAPPTACVQLLWFSDGSSSALVPPTALKAFLRRINSHYLKLHEPGELLRHQSTLSNQHEATCSFYTGKVGFCSVYCHLLLFFCWSCSWLPHSFTL